MEKTLISKKRIRLFIKLLLAPILSKLALVIYLISFLLFTVHLATGSPNMFKSVQIAQNERIYAAVGQINTLSDFNRFMIDFFIPKIYEEVSYSTNIVSPLRIIQYPIKIPAYCFELKTSTVSSSDFFKTFSNECIPHENINIAEVIPYGNSTFCFTENCDEYNIGVEANTKIFTKLRKYGDYFFHIDLPLQSLNKTGFTSQLGEKLNNWIQAGQNKEFLTAMIGLEFSINEKNKEYFHFYRIFIECISVNGPCLKTFKLYNIPGSLKHKVVWDLLSAICLTALTFMFLKALIDYHYLNDKVTMAGMMFFYLIHVAFIAVTLGEKQEFDEISEEIEMANTYQYPLENESYIFIYETLKNSLQPICIFFFGLRILLLISYQNYWRAPIELMLIFYRIIPGIGIICIFCLIFTLGWSAAIFAILNFSNESFTTYGLSIINLLMGDIRNFSSSEFYKSQIIEADNILFPLVGLFIIIMRCVLYAVALSGLIYAFELGIRYIYVSASPDDTIRKTYLSTLSMKIDRFAKENLPQLLNKSIASSRPIVIWLDKRTLKADIYQDIFETSKPKNAKITLFDDWVEIIDFLKYLFRIKPGLLVRSDRWFRIVLETSSESYFQNNDETFEIQRILQFMHAMGTRVPVLVYNSSPLSYQKIMVLKNLYSRISFTNHHRTLASFISFDDLYLIFGGGSSPKKGNMMRRSPVELLRDDLDNMQSESFIE